jgi:hypothetical protein
MSATAKKKREKKNSGGVYKRWGAGVEDLGAAERTRYLHGSPRTRLVKRIKGNGTETVVAGKQEEEGIIVVVVVVVVVGTVEEVAIEITVDPASGTGKKPMIKTGIARTAIVVGSEIGGVGAEAAVEGKFACIRD